TSRSRFDRTGIGDGTGERIYFYPIASAEDQAGEVVGYRPAAGDEKDAVAISAGAGDGAGIDDGARRRADNNAVVNADDHAAGMVAPDPAAFPPLRAFDLTGVSRFDRTGIGDGAGERIYFYPIARAEDQAGEVVGYRPAAGDE